jgi:hypothetical protein
VSILGESLVFQGGLVQMQFDSLGCRFPREFTHAYRVSEIIVDWHGGCRQGLAHAREFASVHMLKSYFHWHCRALPAAIFSVHQVTIATTLLPG